MLEIILIIAFVVVIYFLPIILAKDKPNLARVSIITIFFGWTIVGWVVAFMMAKKDFEVKRGRGRPKGSTKIIKSIENIEEVSENTEAKKRKKSPKKGNYIHN